MKGILAIAVAFAVGSAAIAQTAVLKREPPMGALREGQVVLVDDGTCPSGQVKKVVGGNHVKVGGNKHVERHWSCIAR